MKNPRAFAAWLLLVVVFVALFNLLDSQADLGTQDDLWRDVEDGVVLGIEIDWDDARSIVTTTTREYEVPGYLDEEAIADLHEKGVLVTYDMGSPWAGILTMLVGLLVLLGGITWFLRRKGAETQNIFEFRKSKARELSAERTATFDDVGGAEDAKERLRDVIAFLKDPQPWKDSGARLPRGILLEGPPGCGKTLLARAVAGEADVKFFVVSASEFVEMFVGIGAARVRDMFEKAAKEAPAVLFIDELDAVGRRRGTGIGTGHDEREQTLNQILVCMDGFETYDQLVVIAATNRSEILDPALMRPGRFDARVVIGPPDEATRRQILGIHTKGKPLGPDVDLDLLARETAGATGADLEHLCNEAALHAVRRARTGGGPPQIVAQDFQAPLATRKATRTFDQVDAVLVESATQLARPSGTAMIALQLEDGTRVEGQVLWADAAFVKVRQQDGTARIVTKLHVVKAEALPGTEEAREVHADAWAHHLPDVQ